MPLGRRARKLIFIFAGAALGLLVLLLAFPLWFPWLLRPVARHFGGTYLRYERQGYSRFRVFNVDYTRGRSHFTAQRLEAVVPTVWAWRLLVGRPSASNPFASAEGWRYETLPKTGPTAAPSTGLNYSGQLLKTGEWLPVVTLSNGTLRLPAARLEIPVAVWSRCSLRGELRYAAKDSIPNIQAAFTAHPAGPDVYEATLFSPGTRFSARGLISTTASGVLIQSTNSWWGNRFELQAHFAPGQSLPATARFSAPEVRLPPEALGIPYYRDLTGSVSAEWQDGKFHLDAEGQTQPLPVSTNFPPLSLSLHVQGDTNSAVIQRATLVSPWLTAQLSRGLQVYFTGKLLRERAYLTLAGDLGRQPWFAARGNLSGQAEFAPSWGKLPAVAFHISVSQLGYRTFLTRSAEFDGELDWPELTFSKAEAILDDGSTVRVSGKADLVERNLTGASFRVAGGWLKRWLPPGYDFEAMQASGTVDGRWPWLTYRGELEVKGATSPLLRPLDIAMAWNGSGATFTNTEIRISAPHSSLTLSADCEASSTNARVTLSRCSLSTNNDPVLKLVQPIELGLGRERKNQPWHWRASRMVLEGPGGSIAADFELTWPDSARFNLHLEQVSAALVNDFLRTNLPPLTVNDMAVQGGWSNGPAQFQLALGATLPAVIQHPLSVPLRFSLAAAGNAGGLVVSNLTVMTQTGAVVVASGFLPVSFYLGSPGNFVRMQPDKALNFRATTAPDAFFWNAMSEISGVRLIEPQLSAEASGTWESPAGKISLRARQIELPRHTNAVPDLRNVDLVLDIDRGKARLTAGEVLVQGQRVTLDAELPLPAGFWTSLGHRQMPDWTRASAHLHLEEADLAAFEPLFPRLLAPQGYFSVDLLLRPGGNLEGQADVEHARTRPLGDMGPIRDIGINVRLHERFLTVEGATARIGGAALTLSGQAELAGTNWLKGRWPPFELAIRGLSVPLARTPEFVLRSDLVLNVTKTNGAPPLVAGTANLRDSFYLSDLQNLIPGKIEAPSRRPPYFSIAERALADWRLAVDVQGTRFLKVRSPLFNGEVSVNGKLQGTLEDPIALGDVKVDTGVVRFPFASIPVEQGIITLSSQDPFHPQLSVLGASKQFGYDIRMDITGSVDSPVIQFSSTPPLSSEQILLMVTAGELPQGTFNLSAQQRAQTMALFLGRDILSKFGVGDQAEQRLTVHSGEEISDQGRPTYNVEYKLTDRWSVTGEYDRFGDFNAGLRWRVFSR